ncbi:hypothetical protein CNMCM8686_008140 [Aspergillus fumigatus]|nr:hypothetical protein CNMCM8686_008140 [Aspergillus fumigatus]
MALSTASCTWSTLKLAGRWLGGYSTKAFLDSQSLYWSEPMSARSYGSMRRLNTFGTRRHTNGSLQTAKPPGARCSQNTIFQFSNRMATSRPSSLK